MYPISSTAKAMFDNNYKQVIDIRMDTATDTYHLTEDDVISNSFSIDRYSITGSRIEIGTACAGECKFKIKNFNGAWDNVRFEGAQLFVRIGIADWDTTSRSEATWIPCGYFTIDAPVKNASILSISALDRMAKLDKPANWSQMTSVSTVSALVSKICDLCDVILANGSAISSMPNANYAIVLPTDTEITYRNLLQAACMLLGACAFFNENGLLVIKWYSSTAVSIDESKRYSHSLQENNITITGIYYKREIDSETTEEYVSGTTDYAIDISENPLLGENIQGVVNALGTALNGFTYRPYTAVIKPSPYLYPMDMITFVKGSNSYTCIVSNITFGMNANTSIEGRGETETDNGYATYGDLTNVQSKIVEYAKVKVDKEINDRTMLLMNLNEMVMNSLGLYETSLPISGGGYQYYFHDASTLANSTIIYTMNANGFAWTDDWNDGDPVWNYGITRDGNAIVNMLNAYKISADIITAGTMRAVNLIFGTDPNTTELKTNTASTGALFEGTGVMNFDTKGEFYASNKDANDYEANRIKLTNDSTESSAEMYNYFSNVATNSVDMTAKSTSNTVAIVNNRTGADKKANEFELKAGSTYTSNLINYQYNYLDGNNNPVQANRVYLSSSSSSNALILMNNKGSSSSNANRIALNYSPSLGGNIIEIENYNTANSNFANRIYMLAGSSSNSLTINNYPSPSSTARQFIQMSSSGVMIDSPNTLTFKTDSIHVYDRQNNVEYTGQSEYMPVLVDGSRHVLHFVRGIYCGYTT